MAKQISTEEESNLKRQARRRLIGAVALVLAIVVILPMLFDSEPSPTTTSDIELRIPDKDHAPAFHPAATSTPVNEVVSAVSAAPVASSGVTTTPVSAVSAAPVADRPTKAVQAEGKPKAEPKPIPETKPKVESGAGTKSAPQSGWVVQVGAYSNADTARQMNAKLSKEGYHVYTEKAGSMVRVRVGSYPTREAAEKIKHKLEALGLHPNVVNLE